MKLALPEGRSWPPLVDLLAREAWSVQPAAGQRPNLGDPVEVTVHMDHPELVVHRGLGDEQVWDGRAVPHAVVMREIPLQDQSTVEEVGRRRDDLETSVQLGLQLVVVPSGPGRVQLFEFTHRADEQRPSKVGELSSDSGLVYAGSSAFVQEPAS